MPFLSMSKKKKSIVFVPTNEKRCLLLHDAVFYEILYAFGVSPHDSTEYCAWEHVNFSRMGHARTLYDFFETATASRKQDDAVSEDFGFPARPVNRPPGDRTRLNKDLFHLTYDRLRHTDSTKPWPDTILSCLHERCVEFINHLLPHRSEFGRPEEFTRWEGLLDCLNSGREFFISSPLLENGISPCQIVLGRSLANGRSELTRLSQRK